MLKLLVKILPYGLQRIHRNNSFPPKQGFSNR